MARPQKQTVDYFPHDAHASAGDTLTVLESRFGNNGYAFWFKLLEKLAATNGHYIDCRNIQKWQTLLAKAHIDEATGEEIMVLLLEMEAIDKELWKSRVIWCQHLVDNLAEVYKNRKRPLPEKPVSTPDNPISTPDNANAQGVSTPDNAQSKVKESILNNSKENKERQEKEKSSSLSSETLVEKNVFELYETEGFGKVTELTRNVLVDAIETYTEDWVRDAIKEAVLQGQRKWSYVEGILKNWAKEGRDVEKSNKAKKFSYDYSKDLNLYSEKTLKAMKHTKTIEEMQAELANGSP